MKTEVLYLGESLNSLTVIIGVQNVIIISIFFFKKII